MISTIHSRCVAQETYLYNLAGLSTDDKPIGTYGPQNKIANGSLFTEIDTGQKYMYDAENHQWWSQPVLVDGNEVEF